MILNHLPPEPKLKLDSESLTLVSETEKLLSQIELLTNFTSDGFYHLIKINEAINSYSLDYNTGWNLESYFFNPDAGRLIDKLIHSTEVAQKLLKDVKPSRLIKTIHKELVEEKNAGNFRIAEPTFSFAFPAAGVVPELMNSLEQYLINDASYHPLVNAALVHAQFELIHPFDSHNGIVGRAQMQLLFIWKKKLSIPVLQISRILRSKKVEYFDRLDDLARNNNWNAWVKFMLRVFYEAASLTLLYINKLHAAALRNKKLLIEKNLVTTASLKLIDMLKTKPVITIQQLTSELNYSKQTLSVIISKLLEEQIIEEVSGKQRYRVFRCKNFLGAIE